MTSKAWLRAALAAMAFAAAMAIPAVAEAGGTFGWADFMSEWAAEGVAVGQVGTTLAIMVAAVLIGYGAPNLVPVLVPLTAMAVIMANAETIAGTIGGGAGGGSVLAVVARLA
jgi:hypothetical protein